MKRKDYSSKHGLKFDSPSITFGIGAALMHAYTRVIGSSTAKHVLVFCLFTAISIHASSQAETQNPVFPFWKIKGNAGTSDATNFIGTTDNTGLVFKTNSTEQMRILTNGNVGIGTSIPQARLGIAQARFDSSSVPIDGIYFQNNFFGGFGHAAIYSMGSAGFNGNLIFATDGDGSQNYNATEKMRLTAGGFLAINTTVPKGRLSLSQARVDSTADASDGIFFQNQFFGGFGHAAIYSSGSAGFNGNLVFATDGDGAQNYNPSEKMRLTANGFLSINTTVPKGRLSISQARVDSTADVSDGIFFQNEFFGGFGHAAIYSSGSAGYNGNLIFATDGDGVRNYNPSEKMRLTAAGNLGIGTVTPSERLRIVDPGNFNAYSGTVAIFANNLTQGVGIGYQGIAAIGSNPTQDLSFQSKNTGNINFFTNGSFRGMFSGAGNFGVATNAPVGRLTVADNQPDGFAVPTDGLYFQSTFFGGFGHAAIYAMGSTGFNGNLVFATDGDGAQNHNPTEKMRLTAAGNLAIGSVSSTERLRVIDAGNLNQYTGTVAFLSNDLTKGIGFGYEGITAIGSLAAQDITLNSKGTGSVTISTNGIARLTASGAGNVGVGTTTPTQAKLVVSGSAQSTLTYGFLNNSTPTGFGSGTNNYSIYASDRIAASEFNAYSDARIKNVIGISNRENDLKTIEAIRITDYKFIDTLGKGNKIYKKVIAQELQQVYPQAVSTIIDVVPDIYQTADIKNGYITLPNNLKANDVVKLIFTGKEELVTVLAANADGFKVNSQQEGKVFVYGRQVSDFRTVDYEALTTLNISATQQLLNIITTQANAIEKLQDNQTRLEQELNTVKQLLQQPESEQSKR